MKLTIIGAGNGGITAAYHAKKIGNEVCLYDSPKFDAKIKAIRSANNEIIALDELYEKKMAFPGKEKIDIVTSNSKEAAEYSKYLVFVCPSFAQETLFNELLPHLKDDQVIVLLPGNYGSLVLNKVLKNSQYKNLKLTFVDAITIPWATRYVQNNEIAILGIKEFLPISIWPKTQKDQIWNDLGKIFPVPLKLLDNPIVSGLENINFGGHPLMTICNIGLLENFKGNFNYYRDCCSTATANACEVMDDERLKVGNAYGWKLVPELEAMNTLYNATEPTVYDFNRNSTTHEKLQHAPESSKDRYVTEEVPFLLVPLYELAKKAGFKVAISESLIHLASAYNKINYFEEGRTLAKMGIDDLSVSEIIKLMEE